jgi:pimeloyl-ACP methyl ester carboxylesterase
MRRVVRLGIGLLGAALVLASSVPLYERCFGRKRLRFPYLARPIAEETYSRLATRAGWTKAGLEVEPGIMLRGLLRRARSANAPWVLFYPGNDESQLERGQAFLNRLAGDTDWGLAIFAYRGYDASDGKSELAAMRVDAPRILTTLCATEGLLPARVHLAGFSIGGYFAVHAAGAANKAGQPAATLTLLASVDDIVMYEPSPWEKLSRGEDYQTRPSLADVPAPVLVLQGSADEALEGAGQGRDIAKALGERATYREFESVKHVALLEEPTALEVTRTFIRAHSAQ